jgi:hypothetical protein
LLHDENAPANIIAAAIPDMERKLLYFTVSICSLIDGWRGLAAVAAISVGTFRSQVCVTTVSFQLANLAFIREIVAINTIENVF